QKILHLIAAVIENESVPVRLFRLPGIGVLVEVRPIEITESRFILRKMRGNPIQDDADALLMKIVDEVHEIGRRAKPAGGSEVADDLVSPRTIEWMFHDGEKLDVRKTGVVDVIGQQRTHLAVGEPPVGLLRNSPPGA